MVPMNGRNALVSAVILNWNGGDLVLRCQATLGRQTYPDLEAIVVDNGSTDGSLERLRESKPTPRVVQNQTNLGFAVAANQGIAASAGDWILLLNQDVELEPDYVARLVAAGSAETTIGSVTGKLIRLRDGTQNVIDSTGHVLHRNGWVTNRGEDSPDLGQYEQPGEVFGVTAAAALYRTAMIRDVSTGTARPFDERFFAYNEDVDVDWRARWLGWRAWYEPVVARHVRNATGANRLPFVRRHIVKNHLLLVANNDLWPAGLARLPDQAAFVLYSAVREGLSAPQAALGLIDALLSVAETRDRRRFLRLHRRVDPADLQSWMEAFPWGAKARSRLWKTIRPAGRLAG
jgi:GT2 family glycosyltransferase